MVVCSRHSHVELDHARVGIDHQQPWRTAVSQYVLALCPSSSPLPFLLSTSLHLPFSPSSTPFPSATNCFPLCTVLARSSTALTFFISQTSGCGKASGSSSSFPLPRSVCSSIQTRAVPKCVVLPSVPLCARREARGKAESAEGDRRGLGRRRERFTKLRLASFFV
jgi:hypothetical protein